MSDENEMDYPEDYSSPDKPKQDDDKGQDDGNSQKREEKEEEKTSKDLKSSKNDNPKQNNPKRASLELDEQEREAMRWLNEGEAMRPLIDESPYVRKYKQALYDLAKRC